MCVAGQVGGVEREGKYIPQGTFGSVWIHFLVVTTGGRMLLASDV